MKKSVICAVSVLAFGVAACGDDGARIGEPPPLPIESLEHDTTPPEGWSPPNPADKRPFDHDLSDGLSLGIFYEDQDKLADQRVLNACRYWAGNGVDCFFVDTPEVADIHLTVTDDCEYNEYSAGKVGEATYNRESGIYIIRMHVRCLGLVADFNTRFIALGTALAHEDGHLFGIWNRVAPKETDSPAQYATDSDGNLIWGRAVMNPSVPKGLAALTPVDEVAFDNRAGGYLYPYTNLADMLKSAPLNQDHSCDLFAE